jgi:hypothetical protein
MPTGKNWLNFIYINVAFIGFVFSLYYFTSIQDIKDNWVQYRCNPMYMPLSDNIEQDFTYCVQTMQSNYMGYLLQPLTFITSSLTDMAGSFTEQINDVRNMFNQTRNFITDITVSIYGIFLNIIIEFQKIIIGIKDLVGKMIGILTTLLYVLDGSSKTVESAWNGPSGQLVRSLGNCFHPNTKLKLENGKIVKMRNIHLGDILENGSKVVALMKIANSQDEYLYKLPNRGIDSQDILVSASHLIFDATSNKYIEIKDYPLSVKTNIKLEWFSCLITDTHKIKIGLEEFWDWEDYILKLFPT